MDDKVNPQPRKDLVERSLPFLPPGSTDAAVRCGRAVMRADADAIQLPIRRPYWALDGTPGIAQIMQFGRPF